MNRTIIGKSVLLVAAVTILTLGFSQQSPGETKRPRLEYQTVFTIPIGDAGIHYSGVGPESRPWGPSSFRIAQDGTFWVADTAANRLVQFDREGNFLASVEMPESIVAITDFALDGDTFVILDGSAIEPALYRISPAAVVLDRWTFSSGDRTATGIQVKGGDLLIEQEGGVTIARVADEGNGTATLDKSSRANEPRISMSKKNTFTLSHGQKTRTESVRNTLARAVVLESPSERVVPVLMEEMVSLPKIQVDQAVWLYDGSLRPIGQARVPLANQYVHVERPVAIGPDGGVYALLTSRNHASVVKLNISSKVPSILPSPPTAPMPEFLGSQSKACVERNTMMSTASFYLNNGKSLSATNISGTCSGRTKPRYLTTAKYYYSVPYDWGGNDTVASFNSYMSSSYKAGDINVAASESCSRGVDCSGFVGRVWGKSVKYYTGSLPNISARLSSTAVLKQGDIVNKVEDHVALFVRATSSGAYWYESTMFNNYDRVIYVYHSWSYFSGYTPRRFLDVCGGQSE